MTRTTLPTSVMRPSRDGKQRTMPCASVKLPVGNLSQNVYYKAYLAMNLAASLVHAYHVLKALTGLTGYNLNCRLGNLGTWA